MISIRQALISFFIVIAIIVLTLSACQQPRDSAKRIRIGAIAGPEVELLETAEKIAEHNYGLDIEIIQFSDYTMPNRALADGSIDANMFQHLPYLQQAMHAHNYQLIAIGKTFVYPMGVYSKKLTQLSELPDQAIVAIPNDPSNEARALLLLQQAKLIKLKPDAAINATLLDIAENPKQLHFKELDAAQLPRVLKDVDIAVINTNYALPAQLNPMKDALLLESAQSPYANIVVVRQGEERQVKFQQLMEALHDPRVVAKAQELFHGGALTAWEEKVH